MEQTLEVVNVVVYSALAAVAVRFAMRHRSAAGTWAAATFVVLAAIVIMTLITPADTADASRWTAEALFTDLLVIMLGSFPYLLHRFTRELRERPARTDRLADVGLAVLVIATLVVPPFPLEGEAQPGWVAGYTLFFLVWWGVLLAGVSLTLWRLGAGQAGIVRGRMRLMAVAALLLNLALLGGVLEALQGVSDVLGWLAAAGFLMGLQPLPMLRTIWRAADEAALRDAEVGLLTARRTPAAAEAVAGAAAALVGGAGARVSAVDGTLLAEVGQVEGAALQVEGSHTVVAVTPSRLTPVFGHGEEALLRQLCGHLDLAAARLEALEASEEARAQAEQANTDLQQLVYGVSHDLRNPLVTITGFLNLLEHEEGLDERGRMMMDRIATSARYMQGLVDDLLQLSRVGHADAERGDVALGPLLSGIVEDLEVRYPQVRVDVGSLPTVCMNPIRARQLFANLLENAARYAQPEEAPVRVDITARVEGDWAVVDVADDGQGIPPDQRDRVFQIFQRLGKFDATSEGSGIGLTMCRRIVTDVGGSIDVADTERGTTMRLTLPLTARPARPAARRPEEASA